MLQVTKSIGRLDYDPSLGTFRSWLFQIARHVLLNRLRHAGRRPVLEGGSEWMREEWELEYRRQIFAKAAARVEASCDPGMWTAFWRTAVLDEEAAGVAADLGIALGTLYVRRSRVLARVREAAETIAREWERETGAA
jgi:RNA polymerase sigma-70 factor (ECF subfamily)